MDLTDILCDFQMTHWWWTAKLLTIFRLLALSTAFREDLKERLYRALFMIHPGRLQSEDTKWSNLAAAVSFKRPKFLVDNPYTAMVEACYYNTSREKVPVAGTVYIMIHAFTTIIVCRICIHLNDIDVVRKLSMRNWSTDSLASKFHWNFSVVVGQLDSGSLTKATGLALSTRTSVIRSPENICDLTIYYC